MALTLALLSCFVLTAFVLTVGVLSVLEVLFRAPAADLTRIDTRARAADSLGQEPEALFAQTEMLRNVSQSA